MKAIHEHAEHVVRGADGSTLVHASCIAWHGAGVLLRGPSGAGKSDLALRLIEQGAELVGDDQIRIARTEHGLRAEPAAELAGLLEVRGLGILRLPFRNACRLRLVVDLTEEGTIARLPDERRCALLGIDLSRIALDPRRPSATARVRFALEAVRVH